MRQVPRNIDKPNRNAEFAFTFLGVYYVTLFVSKNITGESEPLLAIVLAVFAVYFMNKLTIDKPEGQAYRLAYRYIRIGKMIPGPKHVKKFEI